jgi:outer membrane lipoprotein-sorting protein
MIDLNFMKHSRIITFFFLISLVISSPASGMEIWDKYSKLKSLSANFKQQKEIKSLGMTLNSHGSLKFNKPDFFEWKVTSPKSFGFIFEKDGIKMLENGQVMRSADATKMDGKMLNAISHLKAWLTMDQKFIQEHYSVKKLSNTEYEFAPLKDPKIFKTIKVITDGKVPVKKIHMVEMSDDVINIEFTDTKMTYEN